jgi:DNA-binding IclR family transcriptional regulator
MRRKPWIPDNDQQIKVLEALKRIEKDRQGVTTQKPTLAEIAAECEVEISIATVHRRMKELLKARVVARNGRFRTWTSNYEFPQRSA